jgi:multisubunit Na+/H+ antiporter MnhE subunit
LDNLKKASNIFFVVGVVLGVMAVLTVLRANDVFWGNDYDFYRTLQIRHNILFVAAVLISLIAAALKVVERAIEEEYAVLRLRILELERKLSEK